MFVVYERECCILCTFTFKLHNYQENGVIPTHTAVSNYTIPVSSLFKSWQKWFPQKKRQITHIGGFPNYVALFSNVSVEALLDREVFPRKFMRVKIQVEALSVIPFEATSFVGLGEFFINSAA